MRLRFHTKHYDVHWHQQEFALDSRDDMWIPVVSSRGWTVIGHDQQHHVKQDEVDAIKEYGVGMFSLWGASNTEWEKTQCFARALDAIVEVESTTPRPFIYNINRHGRLDRVL